MEFLNHILIGLAVGAAYRAVKGRWATGAIAVLTLSITGSISGGLLYLALETYQGRYGFAYLIGAALALAFPFAWDLCWTAMARYGERWTARRSRDNEWSHEHV